MADGILPGRCGTLVGPGHVVPRRHKKQSLAEAVRGLVEALRSAISHYLDGPATKVSAAQTDRQARLGANGLSSKPSLGGKRAAMLTFSLYPADPRPRRAADALLKEGMSVDFLCLGEANSPKREFTNGINVLRLPIPHRRGGKLAYAYEYSSFILMTAAILGWRALKRPYDLVYVHNMPDILVLSALIPKMRGAKVVLDQHDPMPELMTTIFNLHEKSLSVRIIAMLEKWSFARVDRIITVNVACKKIFSSRSCANDKISVVMNSPDESIFTFQARRMLESSTQNGDQPFVIMYHGSIVERNGLDIAIDAFERIRQAIPAAELRIYGAKTPFLERIMEKVRAKNLDRCVHFLGHKFLEELVQEIEMCDVGIIPNHRNSFTDINTPTRILEYLALGKPVIVPRTPGIQDYFDPKSLFFFEAGNAEELAQNIEYVYSHSQETNEIVHRGQKVYLTHTWSAERQTLVDVVSELLSGGHNA